jgi:cytochrome c-type biogenesis protein CcmE
VARRTSPVRLILALSVACVLALFLVYFAIAGGTPQVQPSDLSKHTGAVVLTGKVVAGSIDRNGSDVVRFRLSDRDGSSAVPVVYRDNPPDQFKGGRDISVHGTIRDGVFVGEQGTMVTKCPSKYSASRSREKR